MKSSAAAPHRENAHVTYLLVEPEPDPAFGKMSYRDPDD